MLAILVLATDLGAQMAFAPAPAAPKSCGVGSFPARIAYNPVNHEIYVPNYNSGTISIVAAACSVANTINLPTGAQPRAAVFDPVYNYVYVSDFALNQVYVLHNNTLVGTIRNAAFSEPYGMAYDPADQYVWVADYGTGALTGIQSKSVGPTFSIGFAPVAVAYSPITNVLLVADYINGTVEIVNASAPWTSTIQSVAVGTGPSDVVYDPVTGDDYVANFGSNTVSILDGYGSHNVVATVPVGSGPSTIAFSQSSLHLYVANRLSNNVSEIGTYSVLSTVSLASGSGPLGLAYDEDTNMMYVTGSGNGKLYVVK